MFYALSPLLLPFWHGKYDPLPAALLVLGLTAFAYGRPGWAGAALGLGGAIKWVPWLAAPFLVWALLREGVWVLGSGVGETRRQGDKETRRQGDKETSRQGDGQAGNRGRGMTTDDRRADGIKPVVGGRWSVVVPARFIAGFVIAVAAVSLPFAVRDSANFLAPYTLQGNRPIIGESIWFPFAVLIEPELLEDLPAPWSGVDDAPIPNALTIGVQLLALGALGLAHLILPPNKQRALAFAALAPAIFLLLNRVFSPQYMLLLTAYLLAAAIALGITTRQTIILISLLTTMQIANLLIWPNTSSIWLAASVLLFTIGCGLVVWLALSAMRSAPQGRPGDTATRRHGDTATKRCTMYDVRCTIGNLRWAISRVFSRTWRVERPRPTSRLRWQAYAIRPYITPSPLHLLLILALLLPACSPNQPEQARTFPETGHSLRGDFLRFWEQHDGAQSLGPPISDRIRLDGRETQFFAAAKLESTTRFGIATTVVSVTLAEDWRATVPGALFTRKAASQQAGIAAPRQAEPLQAITVTLTIEGYSGPVELHLFDARSQPAGVWPAQIQDGNATLPIEPRGALGPQFALVLIDGRIAAATSNLFTLDAQTTVQTNQPRFDELYPRIRAFMAQDTLTYTLDGFPVHGYRSPDNMMLWLRDHTYQGRGFRYFEPDVTSLIDAFRRAQEPDGSFPDYVARTQPPIPAKRLEVEADVEYLFVQAVYEAWQMTGDDAWLRTNLDAIRRGIRYTMSDPLRWDAERRLVKRPFTIDTWDFQYGPTTADPTTGRPAPRHWIDDQTIWGIFHGDNTGLAHALELLARMEEHVGDEAAAKRLRDEADGIMERLNALSWNGSFYTHFVPLEPFDVPGVDEAQQLSLSNTYALNRGVLEPEQGRAIVEEYFRRAQERGATFAEWYSIDPPFPSGSFGMGGGKGEEPGEYVNGGIMPLVGGELARGAFRLGAERYAFAILARYHFLISQTNASYLWYYPAGNPGKSGPDTLPTDGWGSSAMLGALIEGAAGIEDHAARYRDVRISPRWTYADDVTSARVVARYTASDGYVAYRWQRNDDSLTLDFTGSAERTTIRLLLPEGEKEVISVRLNGQPHASATEDVFGSWYARLDVEGGSGVVEVEW
jgi:hypothetical protein